MKSKKQPYYGSVKVSERGQIVLPKDLRDKLNIKEGEILFICDDSNCIKIMKSDVVKKVIDKV